MFAFSECGKERVCCLKINVASLSLSLFPGKLPRVDGHRIRVGERGGEGEEGGA